MKKKTNIKININKDDSSLNDFLMIWDIFDIRPNKILIHDTYDYVDLETYFSKYELMNKFTEIISLETDDMVNDKVLIKFSDDVYISYIIIDKISEEPTISDVTFYYRKESNIEDLQNIIEEISEFQLSEQIEPGHKLNVVSLSSTGLDVEIVTHDDIDLENIEEYYSKQTFKDLSKSLKKIKKSQSGLSIFYGDRGTGKSSAIKYLATKLDKTLIFIPNNSIDITINSPEFSKFLKKFDSPIIVLDDCEMIFNEFFTKSNLIANNLLQLVDGVLENKNKLNIITIFNVDDKSEIDHNLLDCNNLINIVEFSELTSIEANQLSETLNNKSKYKQDIRLVDVIKNNKLNDKKRLGF